MRRKTVGLASSLLLGALVANSALGVEVESKASKLEFTGRVQAMWSHSTIDGDPSNEFLLRRARLALKLKVNDWVSGIVEPDFAVVDQKVDLKDAYFKMEPHDNFAVIVGQTKRRFDLFELTSSTQMLIIERDGRIGRLKVPSYSYLTESLGYADRDIGVFVMAHDENERIQVEGGLTNGAGANKRAEFGEKAFQGRVSLHPMADEDLAIHVGTSIKPFENGHAVPESLEVKYAAAFEGSLEYGNFKSGPHLQAGVVLGKNHAQYSLARDESPSFTAFQGIAAYKKALEGNQWFEAIEPLIRVSYADPNTDVDGDGGILVTPGLNLFIVSRTRLSVNADIFLPQELDTPMAPKEVTEVGLKAATWLYW
jgi:hypothetical protein